jgi:hypothetical protein
MLGEELRPGLRNLDRPPGGVGEIDRPGGLDGR